MIALWSAFRVIGVAGKLLLGRPNHGRIESGEEPMRNNTAKSAVLESRLSYT